VLLSIGPEVLSPHGPAHSGPGARAVRSAGRARAGGLPTGEGGRTAARCPRACGWEVHAGRAPRRPTTAAEPETHVLIVKRCEA